jgi:predicted dinucleotide-binding enzyme
LVGSTVAHYGTLDECVEASEVLIWTIRERDPIQLLSSQGVGALKGKLVLDLNNRDYANDVLGGAEKPGSKWFEMSMGEQLQEKLPDSHVMKAFNTVAMEALDTSVEKLRAAQAQVFIAGMRTSKTRELAVLLVEELGFEVVDLGDAPTAMRVCEALGDAVRYIMIENGKGGTANIGVRILPLPDLGIVGEREPTSYH